MKLVWDTEATNLLDHNSIDYTASPYVLKPDFKMHCAVFKEHGTARKWKFVGEECKDIIDLMAEASVLIAHNQINYDLLVMKLLYGLDFEIDENDSRLCTINGREVQIIDTLCMSKVLNPDRYGGHGIEAWGDRLKLEKIDWRAKAIEIGLIQYNSPKGAEFAVYHPEMLVYNERDVDVNELVYDHLVEEWGDWNWEGPFALEQKTQDIITRQSHRGFWFDKELAEANVRDLDAKMEAIREIVEPILPPKPMGVTKLKAFLPPKIQFKKNGDISAVMEKWVAKHGGVIHEATGLFGAEGFWFALFSGSDKQWKLPMDQETPIQTHEPATVKDTTHIKGYLVELGWKPTQYKERDLTCDAKKKKLSPEKFADAVERYVDQTLSSPFCKDRLAEIGTSRLKLRDKLLRHDLKRPLKVYTNPTITVGMEKEIDPALLELADQFPHAKLVSEYLTYAHRRNSILGGGVDPDEMDDDDDYAGKGFLAADRIVCDNRIPTPADTCGAATSRFKHRLVANIPRVTSLYGKNMRGMFGVDVKDGKYQMGYDFDSLEAKIEAHYTYRYEGGPEYGVSLTAEKPNDCHSVLAREISAILGREFPRSTAKNVKYGCSYNAQVARVAKTVGCSLEEAQVIFDTFWKQAFPLKQLKEKMQQYWETTGQKKYLLGLDGRKLPIRSKGNVINTAFQSAGVICAKRAMVIHERKLKEAGLYVDFFRDDWKNSNFCQQLIAYHDEAQLEICKQQVTWKKFASEEECKAFKEAGKVWSDPVHNDKGWFRGYCLAGELATIAVRESGEYYNLNVELSAGYMLGTNWGTCH
jgi:hypothetical protein